MLLFFAGLRLNNAWGQWYGLKTLSTTRKAPFPHEVRSPDSSACFGIRTHDPHTRGRVLYPLGYTPSTMFQYLIIVKSFLNFVIFLLQ